MYLVYLDGIQLPVAPGKIERKVKNRNKAMNLISGDEVNLLKLPGLSEISFECLLPVKKYPFTRYPNDELRKPSYYSSHFALLKKTKRPFDFRILRLASGSNIETIDMDFNMRVTIEEYTVIEDSANAFDIKINVKLKEFREYQSKLITIVRPEDETAEAEVKVDEERPSDKEFTEYTVQAGEGFYNVAMKTLGDGSIENQNRIIEANKDGVLKDRYNGNAVNRGYLLHPGDVLKIPKK